MHILVFKEVYQALYSPAKVHIIPEKQAGGNKKGDYEKTGSWLQRPTVDGHMGRAMPFGTPMALPFEAMLQSR